MLVMIDVDVYILASVTVIRLLIAFILLAFTRLAVVDSVQLSHCCRPAHVLVYCQMCCMIQE